MQSLWKHLDKHHYQKYPITSPRKTIQDSRLDRRLDINSRIHWQLLDRRQQNWFLLYPPWAVPPSLNWPITHRNKKRTNPSACAFISQQTKHSLLLFRERPFSQPSSNIGSFLPSFKGCREQRMQAGRQKLPGSLSCNQTAAFTETESGCIVWSICHLSFSARPDLKKWCLLTRHNGSMFKWVAEEQANTVSSCPPWQHWKNVL